MSEQQFASTASSGRPVSTTSTSGTRSRRFGTRPGNVLVGCLIAVGVVIILIGVGVFFVMNNAGKWFQSIGNFAAIEVMKIDDIPAGEREEMIAIVRGIPTDQNLPFEAIAGAMMEATEGDAMLIAELRVLADKQVAESDLTDDEKQALTASLRGVAAAVAADRLEPFTVETALSPVRAMLQKGGNGGNSMEIEALRNDITADELRALMTALAEDAPEAAADTAAAWPDPSDVLKARLEEILGIEIVPAAAEEPATTGESATAGDGQG